MDSIYTIDLILGKIIEVRTRVGRYSKLEILSYYANGEANEDRSNSDVYTFNFVYQPNEEVAFSIYSNR
ncbi:MAG: hypothetical protein ACOH2D_01340 [Gelidibacter sp.]|uniref:hypothetical protein n=1 Tax=Gelidibacter sp. TaxID=2018083 RepID=UPI003266F214